MLNANNWICSHLQATSFLRTPSSTLMFCCWTCGTPMMAFRSTPTTLLPTAPERWRFLTLCVITTTAPCWTAHSLTPGLAYLIFECVLKKKKKITTNTKIWPHVAPLMSQPHSLAYLWHICWDRVADRRYGSGTSGNVCWRAAHHHDASITCLRRERRRLVFAAFSSIFLFFHLQF